MEWGAGEEPRRVSRRPPWKPCPGRTGPGKGDLLVTGDQDKKVEFVGHTQSPKAKALRYMRLMMPVCIKANTIRCPLAKYKLGPTTSYHLCRCGQPSRLLPLTQLSSLCRSTSAQQQGWSFKIQKPDLSTSVFKPY